MIYIQCEAPSDGAQLLAEQLRGEGLPARRTRDVEKLHKWLKREDLIIGWGEFIPFAGVKVLNGKPLPSKLRELELLSEAGVPVPPFDTFNWGEGWLGRSLHHQEGGDFLPIGEAPKVSFFTRKLEILREFRFHVFKFGDVFKSIRGGERVPRIPEHHPWVRSWDAGWKISYGNALEGAGKAREAAKKALEAVGYDFGAVDVGILRGGEPVVIEVNARPGLEARGKTVLKYVEAIRGIVNGQD